jgi:hypothetical protein
MKARVLALLSSLALGGRLLGQAPEPGTTPTSPPSLGESEGSRGSLTATLRDLDSGKGWIELLTGCGHSLKVVRIPVPPETRISKNGVSVRLMELRRGSIVRVAYRRDGGVMTATAIDLLPAGGSP